MNNNIQVTRFVVNMIEENCYLIWDETGEAALIDCGAFYPEEQEHISNFISTHHLKLTHLFNTHAHFDHIFGASYIYDKYGVKIEICESESETYEKSPSQLKQFLHRELPLSLPPLGPLFKDGDILTFGKTELRVIATPGHTPGGVCFYCEKSGLLFSGDSLFQGAIGRCDLPGGNEELLIKSLKTKILSLPDNVQVLPGHGDFSTIADEKKYNLYLR